MPLNYASYQVDLHQPQEAVGTYEREGALLWPETRHSCTPIAQPIQVDSDLGHEAAVVNGDVNELTESIPSSSKLGIDDGSVDDLEAVELFSRDLLQQHRLLDVRYELISHVQAFPGFSSLMTSPSFDTPRVATSSDSGITRNHTIRRSDISTLLHNTSPLVSASRDSYHPPSALKVIGFATQ
jgi:hypothetical protein